MGSEQSHHQAPSGRANASLRNTNTTRLQRGNTFAGTELRKRGSDDSSRQSSDSRPVSPPISVCSDSDLPYISYTDRPIGDSPKVRNKNHVGSRGRSNSISSTSSRRPAVRTKQRPVSSSTTHNIVVVTSAAKEAGIDRDPDIVKLKSIPMFLPVMRSTLSLPSNRDPEILERIQPAHLHNICTRMQSHYHMCATQVASEQQTINNKIKEVDQFINKLLSNYVEKQKAYAHYAEHFSKIRSISQQISRCNTLLNQNLESIETLNNLLPADERLRPFVWKTE